MLFMFCRNPDDGFCWAETCNSLVKESYCTMHVFVFDGVYCPRNYKLCFSAIGRILPTVLVRAKNQHNFIIGPVASSIT